MYIKRYNEQKVIALYLGNYQARFYLRQISKLTKLPLRTCQNTLALLEKNKIFLGKQEGKNKYFALNGDNFQVKLQLLQAEISQTEIFLEKYPLIKTFLKSVIHNVPLIVFGSFARFEADKESDLDLLVISKKEVKLPFHLLPIKVHQLNLSEKAFAEASAGQEPILQEIKKNHIILNNHSFFVNQWWSENGK